MWSLNTLFGVVKLWSSMQQEDWTPDDVKNRDAFVTSPLVVTEEKGMRNRIATHLHTIVAKAGTKEAELAKARMEELQDVMLEWENLRSDLQSKNPNA